MRSMVPRRGEIGGPGSRPVPRPQNGFRQDQYYYIARHKK
jgi:hypothetical protein